MPGPEDKELKKRPKKVFASPVRLCHSPILKGKSDGLPGKQEDVEEVPDLLSHAAGDGVATRPMKAVRNPNKRKKEGTSRKKDSEMSKEKEGCLTDAQFEKIFQSALQRPLQECIENSGREGFSAESPEEKSLGRGTLEVSLAAKNGVSRNKSVVKNKPMPLETEKKAHRFGKKHQSKLSASKNAEGENEEPGADNGGCKENRKAAPKKKVQGNAPVVIDREEMQEEEEEEEEEAGRGGSGSSELNPPSCSSWCIAWIQCSDPNCHKWRRLSSKTDPSVLPEDWSCSQNLDLQYNSCSISEESWSGTEGEIVYAAYVPGSLVWAKQYGYAWWPGVIEADPYLGEYLLFSSQTDSLPSKYHVTFFGKTVSRAWISASMLRNFAGSSMEKGNGLDKPKSQTGKKNLKVALRMAKEAEQMNIQERIRMFGFHRRFSGRALPKGLQDCFNFTCKLPAKMALRPGVKKRSPPRPKKGQEKLPPGTLVMKADLKVKNEFKTKEHKRANMASEGLSLSKKSRREGPLPEAEAGSSIAKRRQKGQEGLRKPSSVPQHKDNKTKHLSSHADSSSFSGYPRKKNSLEETEISLGNKSKGSTGLEEPSESLPSDRSGEETFNSQETICCEE
nr:PREDICTED: zinc finger CW-type PWWP domain protein 1 isoform X1 [Anolis carolinensis]|eukprot:XP_008121622.1 PREDICTED: zinc finger CW-type PWWP domain protein 1 isoform X1 [Anolis carolinensis]